MTVSCEGSGHRQRPDDQDLYLLGEGTHTRLFEILGAQARAGAETQFAVWAPNAEAVSLIGDCTHWQAGTLALEPRGDSSGIWQGAFDVPIGSRYKYRVRSGGTGREVDKADPFAFACEMPPATASRVASLDYDWNDSAWMENRRARNSLTAPWAIYELHLGSWRRRDGEWLGYRELAAPLADYVARNGFTHVELMPVMEHPFYGSWGYQVTGQFAPTARYGAPQDFMYLIDHLHQAGIGVILDWVPSHFPGDEHGLATFDGTHLYEHADPRQGFHPEWNSWIYNYGRNEVRAFLLSSAHFWIERYHADGLRVDAVSSMLYLDYGRREGEWIPNRYGGRENLEAMGFLRQLNESVYERFPDVQVIAEESTAWPQVSRPTYVGGLGFGMKWNMGWMHDTLDYFARDPVHRRYHHDGLTFSIWYAFSENFVLPLSHDEVVYGKGSLLRKQPGDDWQRRAGLRTLLGYMWTHPGKKLLFMGGELGAWDEWNHDAALDWSVLEQPGHRGIQHWVRDLNAVLRGYPALHELDFDGAGFAWVDANRYDESLLAYLRLARDGSPLLVVANLTPLPRTQQRFGVPRRGRWLELLNSDADCYGGSGSGNCGQVETTPIAAHGHYQSLLLTLPPLGILIMAPEEAAE